MAAVLVAFGSVPLHASALTDQNQAPVMDPLLEGKTREPTGPEKGDVQKYTREVGKDLLYDIFAIDLDLLQVVWQSKFERYTRFDSKEKKVSRASRPSLLPGEAPPQVAVQPPAPVNEPLEYRVRVHVKQTDDIRQMRDDLEDIPFAVRVDARSRLIRDLPDFRTEIYLPLSGRDEFWIRTSVPVPGLGDPNDREGSWRAFTNYSNQLGLSTLEGGFGRRWFGKWNFSYGYRVRFKETREDERRHSWSVGRQF